MYRNNPRVAHSAQCLHEMSLLEQTARESSLVLPPVSSLSVLEVRTSGQQKSPNPPLGPVLRMHAVLQKRNGFISPLQRLGIYFELRDDVLNGD